MLKQLTYLIVKRYVFRAIGALESKVKNRTPKKARRSMFEEFEESNPGKCSVCSYYQHGRTHGFTSERVPLHNCIENYARWKESEKPESVRRPQA